MILSKHKANQGLTLVELIVVLTIIGLLAVVGFTSYQTYLIQSRRSDAINTLRQNQLIIEDYYNQKGVLPTGSDVTIVTTSPAGFYTITYDRVDNDDYELVATAVSTGSQNNDTGCTVITLVNQMDTPYPPQCN